MSCGVLQSELPAWELLLLDPTHPACIPWPWLGAMLEGLIAEQLQADPSPSIAPPGAALFLLLHPPG